MIHSENSVLEKIFIFKNNISLYNNLELFLIEKVIFSVNFVKSMFR